MQVEFRIDDYAAYERALQKISRKMLKGNTSLRKIQCIHNLLMICYGLLVGIVWAYSAEWREDIRYLYDTNLADYLYWGGAIVSVVLIIGSWIFPTLSYVRMVNKQLIAGEQRAVLHDDHIFVGSKEIGSTLGYRTIDLVERVDGFLFICYGVQNLTIPLSALASDETQAESAFEIALKEKMAIAKNENLPR